MNLQSNIVKQRKGKATQMIESEETTKKNNQASEYCMYSNYWIE